MIRSLLPASICFFASICLFSSSAAFSWDPLGDIQNPARILRNSEREFRNSLEAADRAHLESQAQINAPILEQWLIQSRNSAMGGSTSRMPARIRAQLRGFYQDEILDSVRFKVGDGGVFNAASLSVQYGGAGAVTLVDVIVFTSENDANFNTELWAHELKHIQQFREWGTRDFAIRYLRSWRGVEADAYTAQALFPPWRAHQNRIGNPPDLVQGEPPPFANSCVSRHGECRLSDPLPAGSRCSCPSARGQFFGIAR